MILQKDNNTYEVQDGRIFGTVLINGGWVSNPTVEMCLADGYIEIDESSLNIIDNGTEEEI